ncbi:MAG TPA: helix-turn-helix domain-containing protein [Polyangiaceae bacterium]|nr:helix-turn-helix domain-containing protein [Polyangiaceae bacterium]
MTTEIDWVAEVIAGLPALVTVKEAVAALRMSRRHFYRLVARGQIKTVQQSTGGSSRHLIARGEIARYLRSLDARAA